MPKRTSRKQLEAILLTLGDRDMEVLRSVWTHRYLTTEQIRRLYFTSAANPTAGLRATTRNLNKLRGLALVDRLERRIGGVGSGSGSYVWRLLAAGEHLLRMSGDITRPKQKRFEPSRLFLAHTLAVSEFYVRLTEICVGSVKLTQVQSEPDSWRTFRSGGKKVTLRPDLFAITENEQYEDQWLFEVDLDTEAPARIIEKCRRYQLFYRSGSKYQQGGVFPLVVFIVPDETRKAALIKQIRAEFRKQRNIFTVITPEELAPLIIQGPDSAEGGTGA